MWFLFGSEIWKIISLMRCLLKRKIGATISKTNVNSVMSKCGGNSFCTRVFCFLLFSIWLHSTNLHLELEYRILCSIVSAWNRYKYILIIFKKWLWVLKIVANISRSFLKIISNKVARSLTVTSGFEILFAKIPLDIFRFTIYIYYWSEIDKKIYWK